jgi:hypothetical protein
MSTYESQSEYRGYTIAKTISKTGAVHFVCEIAPHQLSRHTDLKRLLNVIDQLESHKFLNEMFTVR